MKKTKIEWCDSTVNPVFGCTYGCPYCYAKKLNNRFKWIEEWNKPVFFQERLKQLNTKKTYNIFMNSMSDIADWEIEWIREVWKIIVQNPQNNYLFLTKRPKELLEKLIKAEVEFQRVNIWIGLTITGSYIDMKNESLKYCEFINFPESTNLFLSLEPLHDYNNILDLTDLKNIKWIIMGAETGNRKDKVIPKERWIDEYVSVADDCYVPVFMKNSLVPIIGEENMIREFPKELKK